jgi:hypothetical protein
MMKIIRYYQLIVHFIRFAPTLEARPPKPPKPPKPPLLLPPVRGAELLPPLPPPLRLSVGLFRVGIRASLRSRARQG